VEDIFEILIKVFSQGKIEHINEVKSFIIESKNTENHIYVSGDEDFIILDFGEISHCHPADINETIQLIKDYLGNQLIIWKVSRPNGYWYAGHYSLKDWIENKEKGDWYFNLIDQPDSLLEVGDRIERFNYQTVIEDRFI